MKKFSELKIGDEFFSTCSISEKELEAYLNFSRIKNVFLEDMPNDKKIISGRALISRMEGEFTRLSQIYGNHILHIGTDGDPEWNNRSTRFLKPFFTDQVLKIKFRVSGKEDIDENSGKITIDFEGTNQNNELIIIARKNIYRMKK